MYIKNKNLVIRNAEKQDSHLLAKWWNDGDVMVHVGFPNGLGTTPEEVEKKIATDSEEHAGDCAIPSFLCEDHGGSCRHGEVTERERV